MIYCVNWHDLEFQRIAVPFRSTAGVPQTRWLRVGMPYIPQNVINSVFYLYASVDDARAGRDPGGTGFLVWFPHLPGTHVYGVTNWHVAVQNGFSVIRLNTNDGSVDVIDLGPEDWHFLPARQDVAVVPLSLGSEHAVSAVPSHDFAEKKDDDRSFQRDPLIGVGDDVFMIGLFVDHDGVTTNVPSARFGHISMLPNTNALIEQPNRYFGESYIVDMHSRCGFSGSPVFVYRTFGSDLRGGTRGHEFEAIEIADFITPDRSTTRASPRGPSSTQGYMGRLRARSFFKFLGIHWGQFPEEWELRQGSSMSEARKKGLITDGAYVKGMSGMTCVIPAWQIMEVFELPQLKKIRAEKISAAPRSGRPEPESRSDAPSDVNPEHREDFNRLVGAAAKKRPPTDQT